MEADITKYKAWGVENSITLIVIAVITVVLLRGTRTNYRIHRGKRYAE